MASHALDEGDAKRRASRRLTRTASLHQPILLSTVHTVCVGVVELKQLINVGAATVLMVGSAKLCEAVEKGDTAEVRRLVRSGADVEGPLYHAAWKGHAETAKALIELGATVDGRNPRLTPLHTAVHCGHAGEILMLPSIGSPTPFHAPT
jgi:hypothetical protein